MGVLTYVKNLLGAKRARHFQESELGASWLLGPNNIATGRYITDEDALKVSAVFACIRVHAEDIAKLPFLVYRKLDGGGKERDPDHFLWNLLRFKPNPLQDSFQFFEMGQTHLGMKGNFYAQRILDGRGRTIELYPLNPDCVRPYWEDPEDEESLRYEVHLPSGQKWTLSRTEILHVRGLATNGVLGLSPLDLARQTIGTATAQEEHAAAFFGKGVRAAGVLEHPMKISKEAADRLKKSFEDQYAGNANAYRTILLEEGIKWNQVSLSHEQSQFLESREFAVEDIARWYRIPPHKIGHLKRATYSNIEHQGLEYVTDSLSPWLVRWERAILTQLVPQKEWNSVVVEFLVDALLRGDTKTRYEAYSIGRQNGWLNADEIRERENMNPLPDGKGQIYLEPLNMKEAGTDPEPALSQDPATAEPEEDQGPDEIQLNAWRDTFHSRILRAVRREHSARQRGSAEDKKLVEYLYSDLSDDVRNAIRSLSCSYNGHRETLLREAPSIQTITMRRWTEGWVDASRIAPPVESWDVELRAEQETARLMEFLMGTMGGMLSHEKGN